MKRKFKVGDKAILLDDRSCHNREIGSKVKIVEVVSQRRVGFIVDDPSLIWWTGSDSLKLIKPKEKQSDKIRRIVREEMDIQNKKLDRLDKALVIAKSATNAVNNLKDLAQRMPIPNWGGEGTKCEQQQLKSGWYKNETHPNWLVKYDFEHNFIEGFDLSSNWVIEQDVYELDLGDIPATNEEVITRLVDYIKNNLHNK